jgi:hypothetical protein
MVELSGGRMMVGQCTGNVQIIDVASVTVICSHKITLPNTISYIVKTSNKD